MQNNTITLGEATYDRFKETPDKTTYVSNSHTVAKPDLMLLGRTVANNDGANAKSRVSFVQDIERADDSKTTGRVFFTGDFSYPQWATEAQLLAIKAKFGAFMSSTECTDLIVKQSI